MSLFVDKCATFATNLFCMQELKDFGKIEFVRNKRAKRVSVKIKSDGLKVSMPHHVSKSYVIDFILSKKNEIFRKQQKIQKKKLKLQITPDNNIQTLTFSVKVVPANRQDLFFSLQDKVLSIEVPRDVDMLSDEVQEACWEGINHFLKKEAKRVLTQRVFELAKQYNFKVLDVKIQSSKTRWGSCSQKRNINLSFYLMLLPMHLIDYVILHELCHTREMNHGIAFWKLMDQVTNNQSNALKKELKKYEIP
jgi:predicted metal-dependent hydrolase